MNRLVQEMGTFLYRTSETERFRQKRVLSCTERVLGTGEWHNLTRFCAGLGAWNWKMAQFDPVLCHRGIENEKNGTFRVRFVTFWVIAEVSRLGGEPARNEHNEPPRTRNGHFLVRNK